jgi:hypothetical protein
MNKTLYIVILVVGIILLIFGLNAQDSLVSVTKEAVTGTPTDKSMGLIICGVVGIVVGGLGAMFQRGKG